MLELIKNVDAAPGVVCVLCVLEVLNLHEQVEELVEALNHINVNLEQRFQSFLALGVLVHGSVVDGIPAHNRVLLGQNLPIPRYYIASILLKEGYKTQVKLSVPLDGVSVVLHRFDQLTLLDVHRFHTETALFLLKLVVHDFFETHALKTEQTDQAVVVTLVGQDVVRVQTAIIQIQLMENHVTGSTHLERQVDCYVLKAQMTAEDIQKRDD